jgi:hypothetical protein
LLLPYHFAVVMLITQSIIAGFMVNSFLQFAATNQFKISFLGIGPTEIRIFFIVINTLIVCFGKTHLAPILPYALAFSLFGLIVVVYNTQREIWEIDMKNKK